MLATSYLYDVYRAACAKCQKYYFASFVSVVLWVLASVKKIVYPSVKRTVFFSLFFFNHIYRRGRAYEKSAWCKSKTDDEIVCLFARYVLRENFSLLCNIFGSIHVIRAIVLFSSIMSFQWMFLFFTYHFKFHHFVVPAIFLYSRIKYNIASIHLIRNFPITRYQQHLSYNKQIYNFCVKDNVVSRDYPPSSVDHLRTHKKGNCCNAKTNNISFGSIKFNQSLW